MGTSTGYKMPTGGEWTPLKREATRFVKDSGGGGTPKPHTLVNRYVGSMAISGGFGGAGGPAPTVSRVGQSLGNFFARVGTVGLAGALREIGLGHLVGKSAMEVASALVEALVGPASTLDDAAARAACDDLQQVLLGDAGPGEVEQAYEAAVTAQGLDGILWQFLEFYIYERFLRDFYEAWEKAVGRSQAAAGLDGVKSYIEEALQREMSSGKVTAQSWDPQDGGLVVQEIIAEVCHVFGATP